MRPPTNLKRVIRLLYSLKNRLIAFFVVLLVLSFGTMSYFLFHESRSIIRSYIESSALEKMDEYGSFVNMALTQIYDLSSLVFNSPVTKSWDTALSDPALPDGEKMLADLRLSEFLTQTTNNYSGVSSVTIYRREGMWVGGENQVVMDRSFQQESWYRDFMSRGVQWVSAHSDPAEARRSKPYQVVSLLLPVGTFEPTQSRSVMKVNVSADFLLEPLNRIHLGESGTLFLLDQEGRPVLSQTSYASHPDAIRKVEEIRLGGQPQGVVYARNAEDATDIIVYKKLKMNNWLLVGFVPEQDLYSDLTKLRTSILFAASLLLLVAVLAATWLSHGITKPLSRLASAMRSVQKGDFTGAESRMPPEGSVRNEVGFVSAAFRNMVERLREHIKIEFELKLLRQQAEYKALLMQINPHFLFNTLELLSSLSMQQRTADSVQVIDSLGKMLRFSLKISDDLVPLEEELKYMRYYVSILQIRFGERLHMRVRVEGGAGKQQIVKFLLQPLIENAVKYSFRRQAAAEVDVEVVSVGGRVRLIVADNGPGMPPGLAEQLYKESAMQFDQILRSASREIGLRNVLARCQLYYGTLFSFRIESGDGGTRIELTLPAQEGVQDVPSADCG